MNFLTVDYHLYSRFRSNRFTLCMKEAFAWKFGSNVSENTQYSALIRELKPSSDVKLNLPVLARC